MKPVTQLAEEYIYNTISVALSGTSMSGVGIYINVVPPKAIFPYVVCNLQVPGKDSATFNEQRVHSNLTYLVKVIGKECKPSDIGGIVVAIDEALQKTRDLTNGISACFRVNPISYTQIDNGITYVYSGGLYKILVLPYISE